MEKILIFLLFTFFLHNCLSYTSTVLGSSPGLGQTTELTPSDGYQNYYFSSSLAMTEDVIVVGTQKGYNGYWIATGSVYIYRRTGNEWNEEAKLTPSDGQSDDLFGASVAIFGDFIAVGAPDKNNKIGKVYTFQYNSSAWIQQQMITASDGIENDTFGSAIAFNDNLMVITAAGATYDLETASGKAYVFQNQSGTWVQSAILNSSEVAANGNFGGNVLIQNEIIFITANKDNVSGLTNAGKVYIYQYNITEWVQIQTLIADDAEANQAFATSIAISDGILAVGSTNKKIGSYNTAGKVYLFIYNGTEWVANVSLTADSPQAGELFGSSCVFMGNSTLVIGAEQSNVGSYNAQGRIYVFSYNSTDWNQLQMLTSSNINSFNFFGSVMTSAGIYVVPGSDRVTVDGKMFEGQAYVFSWGEVPDQVNIINCSGIYDGFECYWDEVANSTDIEYTIFHNSTGELVQESTKIDTVFVANFTSSLYSVLGNQNYTIQMQACNKTTTICGAISTTVDVFTRIGAVNNFVIQSTNESITANWTAPDVPVPGGIPLLDHYNVSYNKESNPAVFQSLTNDSKSVYIPSLDSYSSYSFSIWPCRTLDCEGEDQGEVLSTTILTRFNPISNLQCNSSMALFYSCSWDPPVASGTPTYYHFVFDSVTGNDDGEYTASTTSQNFVASLSDTDYDITVSACDSNMNCGITFTIQLKTPTSSAVIQKYFFFLMFSLLVVLFF
eukprot:Anaeramoba_ignava/a347796_407.p1 GENE.a347796_407~~a347796_407.p1  ORF type:complete len:726 (+),score=168.82 a347796_407:54-2231(+)